MIQNVFSENLTVGSCTRVVWECVVKILVSLTAQIERYQPLKWDIKSFLGHTKHLQQTLTTFYGKFLHYMPWFYFFNLKRIMLGTCAPNFRSRRGVEDVLKNPAMQLCVENQQYTLYFAFIISFSNFWNSQIDLVDAKISISFPRGNFLSFKWTKTQISIEFRSY